MIEINLPDLEEVQEFEFWSKGKRLISVSITKKNLAIQIPSGVNSESIMNSENSFFLRTKDR